MKGISTITKEEFLKSVTGVWDYKAETQGLTKANFALSLPLNAIKILSFKNDLVLDPFSGSATTALACLMTKRNYLGFEISEKYWKIGNNRLQNYIDRQNCSLKELL
jgi:site-specific DNA-methyltransferase (adenine-specific)